MQWPSTQVAAASGGGAGRHAAQGVGSLPHTSFSKLLSVRTATTSLPGAQLSQHWVPLRSRQSCAVSQAVSSLVRKSTTAHWPCTQSATKYLSEPSLGASGGHGAHAISAPPQVDTSA